ncbi:MAG: hypothetical protein ACYTGB_05250 [Planctomycetota bacterium]|jgi:hypothetical protein
MKLTTRLLAPVAGALLLSASAFAGTPGPPRRASFASKPSAAAEGEGVRIRFAVAAPCDVDVTVLDAKGAEVCHLAAGLLGAKEAAAPLAPGKLAQSLLWDRKDDWGRPVAGGNFSVRVRLGMKAGGARPILKAKIHETSKAQSGGAILDPDPAEVGHPGLTPETMATGRGKTLASRWGYGWHLKADKEDDRLYAAHTGKLREWYRYMGSTGKVEPFDVTTFLKPGEHFRVGPGGEIHITPYRKLTRELKKIPPLDVARQREGCNRFYVGNWYRWRAGPFVEHWNTCNRAPELGLDGRCYIYIAVSIPYGQFFVFDRWEKKRALREGFQPWLTYSNKSDGGHFGCLRVDTKGKIYIAAGRAPMGHELPGGRYGHPWLRKGGFSYGRYGSIVKFDPRDRWAKDFPLPMGAKPEDPEELKKGVLWSSRIFMPRVERCYPGVMSWLWDGCVCSGSTFQLDEHGRLYYPDAGRESVVVTDNAGNEILRLAKTVAAGPEGKGARLNMGWPHRVECTRKALYFTDGLNRRVIRVPLGWAAEEKCPIK